MPNTSTENLTPKWRQDFYSWFYGNRFGTGEPVNPLFTNTDEFYIITLAQGLRANNLPAADWPSKTQDALHIVYTALKDYRTLAARALHLEAVERIPIEKPEPAIPGKGCWSWRVLLDNGVMMEATNRTGGTSLRLAKEQALELLVANRTIQCIVPPDFDPHEEDRQRNLSKQQPPGMTVRQREKKH